MVATGYNTAITLNNKIMEELPYGERYFSIPEKVVLYALRKLSAPAFRLFIVLAGQKNGFTGAMKTYCTRANITVNNYSKYRDELIKKGFLEFTPYKEMTITVPEEAYTENYQPKGSIFVVKYDSEEKLKNNEEITGEDILALL